MASATHVKAMVLSGGRIEITAPEFREGEAVDVFLVGSQPASRPRRHMVDLMASFPSGPRSGKTWDEIEERLQTERDSWER